MVTLILARRWGYAKNTIINIIAHHKLRIVQSKQQRRYVLPEGM
jgi:hypothetical protein